ncbi:hypothetical protein [Caballeronia sp.]|uniref:hypothetical protein n=1 Tax=Caballeronia sp. TaxID=1931223 RepID=UPI003C43FE98
MKSGSVLLTILLGVVAFNVSAADFDGSKPLLCATVDAHTCDAGSTCIRSLPEDIGAPNFLSLDFAKKVIVGPARTSPMLTVNQTSNQIVMEGMELGYGWTLVVDSGDGSMTLMIVNSANAFVLFGNCTVR